jgi:hypothetical protein
VKTKIYFLAICCLFLSSVSAQKSNKKKSKAVAEIATPVLPSGKALYFKNDPVMDQFITNLMSKMTLDEKIGQLN